jgi:SAM-dependent methyltransferase
MGRLRIAAARFMIRSGKLIQVLAAAVLRPDDLIAFSRETYTHPTCVADWCRADLVDEGLNHDELELLRRSPVQNGRLLLLGLGGGREAIPLAKQGFLVTGVDFVAGMVERAKARAASHGVPLEGWVQEISQLDVPHGAYDLAWLSARMYSCVPTQRRRVQMLRRIAGALRAGGCFICQYDWAPEQRQLPNVLLLYRSLAWLTRGHLQFEPGDTLWANVEFIHRFTDETGLRREFAEGGFEVLHLDVSPGKMFGGAVLQKKNGL